MNAFDEDRPVAGPWPNPDADLLDVDDWGRLACMDWPRDRWLGYIGGYRKGAEVIAAHVARTGRDQDYLVYPFLMCWRHYIELQLKVLIALAATYRREPMELRKTHKIDHLWRVARPLLERGFPSEPKEDLDDVERVLLQLHSFDPTSEHFRYPVETDGSETLTTLGRIHIHRFHEIMDGVAHFLDAVDTGIRQMIDTRAEYEEAMRDLYGC